MIKEQVLVQQIHVVSNENSQRNEITAIDWRVIVEEQINETQELVVEERGTVNLPKANSSNYIPFEELNNETLLSWCETSVDFDVIKEKLKLELIALKNTK
jgi:hypothetical protein